MDICVCKSLKAASVRKLCLILKRLWSGAAQSQCTGLQRWDLSLLGYLDGTSEGGKICRSSGWWISEWVQVSNVERSAVVLLGWTSYEQWQSWRYSARGLDLAFFQYLSNWNYCSWSRTRYIISTRQGSCQHSATRSLSLKPVVVRGYEADVEIPQEAVVGGSWGWHCPLLQTCLSEKNIMPSVAVRANRVSEVKQGPARLSASGLLCCLYEGGVLSLYNAWFLSSLINYSLLSTSTCYL